MSVDLDFIRHLRRLVYPVKSTLAPQRVKVTIDGMDADAIITSLNHTVGESMTVTLEIKIEVLPPS